MLEHKTEPLLSWPRFMGRILKSMAMAQIVVVAALAIGVLGYHFIAEFAWIDALLNACMILAGMGPMGELHSNAAKLFASGYALFSGLVFIVVMGVVLTPLLHRLLHAFHLEQADDDDEEKTEADPKTK